MNHTNHRIASRAGFEPVDGLQLERISQLVLHLCSCSDERRSEIAAALDLNGAAFAAFMLYPAGTEPTSDSLVEDFNDQYRATFADWAETVNNVGEIFGWHSALADLRDEAGEPMAELLAWDDAAVQERFAQHFTFPTKETGMCTSSNVTCRQSGTPPRAELVDSSARGTYRQVTPVVDD